MRYFELLDDITNRRRWYVGEILLPDGTEPRLRAGIWLPDSRPLHAEVRHIGRVLDFCRTNFAVPIATTALANAIRSIAGADVQCIPLAISGQAGMMVLNAIRVIRCVNEQRSEFDKWADQDERPDKLGQYRYISKLVLDQKALPPDAHFFRVNDWSICLIVSEVVKDAMERVGCYGAEFVELELA